MFTITKDDFKNLHNAKCELHFAVEHLQETLSPAVIERLQKCLSQFREGMKYVYEQETRDFNYKNGMYRRAAEDNDFRSTWSIYGVADLNNIALGFDECTVLRHDCNWNRDVNVELPAGPKTWLDLWRAADQAVRESGDLHHSFIEDFVKTEDGALRLVTGS